MSKKVAIAIGLSAAGAAIAWYLFNRSKQAPPAAAQPQQKPAQRIMAESFSEQKTEQTPKMVIPAEATKYIQQPSVVHTAVQQVIAQPQKIDVPVITTMPREAFNYIQPMATVVQPIVKTEIQPVAPVKTASQSGGALVYSKDISSYVQEYPQYSRNHTVAVEGLKGLASRYL